MGRCLPRVRTIPAPFGSNQICSINKNYSPGKSLPYTCTPGCKLGEVSEYMVPIGTYIRIPLPNNPKRCLQICKCTIHGIQECQPVPCVTLSPCWMGNSYEKPHGTNFAIECNTCSCYVSEVICSKKQCETTSISGKNTAYTTLPCNCPPHYVPVCGRNGNIYPSACLAKCAELSDGDIEYEACPDPCRSNPCPIGHKCVPDPKVCLTLMDKPCLQYQCVNGNSKCELLPKEPVCDINNQQFDNACFLAHSNKKLAYRGPCLKNCENNWEVCGINGRTYASECAAWSDYTSVDYRGACVAVGLITDKKRNQCPGIKCKPLPDPNCLGFTPPGACCPICGGTLRLLYSRKQIDRALYVLHNKDTYPLTLRAMLQALARTIQVSQCALRGYLTVEMDIFVIVETTEKNPSQLQLEACIREAEKIASLVNTQSPRVVSELSLSSLVLATPVHTQNNYAGTSMVVHTWMSPLVVVGILLVLRLVSKDNCKALQRIIRRRESKNCEEITNSEEEDDHTGNNGDQRIVRKLRIPRRKMIIQETMEMDDECPVLAFIPLQLIWPASLEQTLLKLLSKKEARRSHDSAHDTKKVIHTYLQEQNQGPIYYLMLNVPKRPELPPRSYIISKTLPPPAND
ncbi:Kazal-type serine protease inhibitor domain [Popillia japonica]|uniref:Kazal-type serine protease inhibitor domain n=1 Tax=Popillia japonica TaxID=7064 RepID=A0AAW1IDS3_POPJA